MWKRHVAAGIGVILLFFAFTFAIGSYQALQPAEAALAVNDANNIYQNTLNAVNTATIAMNTATQISNQVRNLASLTTSELNNFYSTLTNDMNRMSNARDIYTGMLDKGKTLDSAWSGAFKDVNTFFNSSTRPTATQNVANKQSTLATAQATNKDSLVMSKTVSDASPQVATDLQTAVTTLNNADGAKQAIQAHGLISSMMVKEQLKENAMLAQYLANVSASNQSRVQEEAASLSERQAAAEEFNNKLSELRATVR